MCNVEKRKGTFRRPLNYLLRRAVERLTEGALTFFYTLVFRLKCLWSGVPCGNGVRVFGRVILRAPGSNVQIGDRVSLISSSWRCSASALAQPVRLRTFSPDARIVIDAEAGLNGTSITARTRVIRIGRGAMIGPDCLIMDSDFHQIWPVSARNAYDPEGDRDVTIGDNAWLGARCIVLKGGSVGENSVVAAGSVVVHSIPPNVLAAGNPARIVRRLDSGDEGGG